MKRQFLLLVMAFAVSASAMAQEATTTPTDSAEVASHHQLKDLYAFSESLEGVVATGVAANPNQLNNRYKLYPTDNMWTFLKLDTCTGSVWQVQFVINGDNRMQSWFIFPQLKWDESWEHLDNIGRFELYPTQNMYNFLLMDKKSGRIWQIQWSTNPDNRGLISEIK